jgi:hypothetical protein
VNRTRTALIALLAAVAVPGLSACSGGSGGGTVHTGSAAVLGGQRISIATVQDQTAAFRQAAPATGGGTGNTKTWGQDSPGVDANVLNTLIQERVIQAALSQNRLTVSAGDVAAAEAPDIQQAQGRDQLTARFVNAKGLPPQDLDDYYRLVVGERTLLAHAGISTSDPSAAQKFFDLLRPAAASLGISVNPRYGSWDATNLTLGGTAQPWIKQVSQDNAG